VATGNANAIANCRAVNLPANFTQLDASGKPTNAAAAASITPFLSGANDKLKPETSLSKTLGLVYSPSYVDGLNMSLDWYNIRIKNEISAVSSNDVLEDCYLRSLSASCNLFSRNAQGQVINLSHTYANRGSLETEGYDFNVTYRLPDTAIGKFRVSLDTNYVSKYNETLGNGVIDYNAGQYSNWRVRSNANLDWSYGDFGATWGLRYYSGLKENCTFDVTGGPDCGLPNYVSPGVGITPKRQVGAIAFNDLQVRWNAPWNATISVGANNVFNRQTPLFYTASSNTIGNSGYVANPSYDIGRFWYVRYNQKF
jgi:iron complex outermembrane receptor protein